MVAILKTDLVKALIDVAPDGTAKVSIVFPKQGALEGRVVESFPRGEISDQKMDEIAKLQALFTQMICTKMQTFIKTCKTLDTIVASFDKLEIKDLKNRFNEGEQACFEIMCMIVDNAATSIINSSNQLPALLTGERRKKLIAPFVAAALKPLCEGISLISPFYLGNTIFTLQKSAVTKTAFDLVEKLKGFSMCELEKLEKIIQPDGLQGDFEDKIFSEKNRPAAQEIFRTIQAQFEKNSPLGRSLAESFRAGLATRMKELSQPQPSMCSGVVSEAPRDAAEADARITPEVNDQRPFTRGRSAADAPAPSEVQALNTPEHIPQHSM